MKEYPEILELMQFKQQTAASVKPLNNKWDALNCYTIQLKYKDLTLDILTDDEYGDLKIANPLLHLELALRELNILKEEPDFLAWSNTYGLPAGNSALLAYYKDMVNTQIPKLEAELGPIQLDHFISDFDFTLNAGAAQALRELRTTMP